MKHQQLPSRFGRSERAIAAVALLLAAFLTLLGVQGLRGEEGRQKDREALEKLNVEIGAAEDKGDRKRLEGVLAPKLAFRRASGKIVDREEFLKDVKPRGPSKTRVESVTFHGKDRAAVICIVTAQAEGRDTMYHNIRLFVRHDGGWKLLGWANEPL